MTLRLVDPAQDPPEDSGSVKQERAEAMWDVAGVMRRRALQLPEDDDLRRDLLKSAACYCSAARIEWPDYPSQWRLRNLSDDRGGAA